MLGAPHAQPFVKVGGTCPPVPHGVGATVCDLICDANYRVRKPRARDTATWIKHETKVCMMLALFLASGRLSSYEVRVIA